MTTAASLSEKSTNVRQSNGLSILRLALAATAKLSPALAVNWAQRLFLRAQRYPWPAAEQACLQRAEIGTLYTAGLPQLEWDGLAMRTYRWGEARRGTVALLHGWAGRASQFHVLIDALVAAGYQVVAIDAPGHGASGGGETSVLHFINAIERLVRNVGPVTAVIAHSVGGAATVNALAAGLRAQRAVLIAPAADLKAFSQLVARQLGLSEPLRQALQQKVERRFGLPWQSLHAVDRACELTLPGLVIHDEKDNEVPWRVGSAIAQAWPQAQLATTRGLGHRRLLKDSNVIEQVLAFVGADTSRR